MTNYALIAFCVNNTLNGLSKLAMKLIACTSRAKHGKLCGQLVNTGSMFTLFANSFGCAFDPYFLHVKSI